MDLERDYSEAPASLWIGECLELYQTETVAAPPSAVQGSNYQTYIKYFLIATTCRTEELTTSWP